MLYVKKFSFKNDVLNTNQYGFKKGRLTLILYLNNILINSIESDKPMCTTMLLTQRKPFYSNSQITSSYYFGIDSS